MQDGIRLLMLEDDRDLLATNTQMLRRSGYTVYPAATLREARRQLHTMERLDIAVLDVLLPDGSGLDFVRDVKELHHCPVLMLPSLDAHEDIVRGMNSEADLYMTKPFRVPELVARMEGLLKRQRREGVSSLQKGLLRIDMTARVLYLADEMLAVTPREFSLLGYLAQREGEIVTGETLYRAVWGQTLMEDTAALRSTITRLRKKLQGSGYMIVSIRGKGYAFERM